MRSKKPFSAGKPTLVIFITLLLASATVPTEAQGRKFKVLHTFHGAPDDGQNPLGVLVRDSEGNLYGTTNSGGKGRGPCGSSGCGTVFKMSQAGKLIWLHSLTFPKGAGPMAGLPRGKAGDLYGTATFGAVGAVWCSSSTGTVRKLRCTSST
jgi:uncharacterized repeat protein (TIGR03803 family)